MWLGRYLVRAGGFWLVILFLLDGVLLSAPSQAATPLRTHTAASIGPLKICAYLKVGDRAVLTARSIRSCLSSSCRGFLRSNLRVVLEKNVIRVKGVLFHRKPLGRSICTRDCRGAKTVPFATPKLLPGRYTIFHNGQRYGAINLIRGGKGVCVSGSLPRKRSLPPTEK